MGITYQAPPAKRGFPVDPNQPSESPSSKLPKHSSLPSGHVSFRLLCHASRVGGIIGRSGSLIKQLQQQTGAKIRVEEAQTDCPDRVVALTAPRGSGTEPSPAQEALLRVFERVLEVAAESDGKKAAVAGIVSCRMLADAGHVGAVIGKGGKVIEKIKKDCGVMIRVVATNLPACAGPTDEVIEIDGDASAVKKALVAVSGCLQDQSSDRTKGAPAAGSRSVQATSHPEGLPAVNVDTVPRYTLVFPPLQTSSIRGSPALPMVSDHGGAYDSKLPQIEVIFRLLCLKDKVGGVIGKGGSIIQGIQNETGASVTVGPTLNDCDERIITVTVQENPELQYSAAQKAVVLVVLRTVDSGPESAPSAAPIEGSPVTARLVISPNQVGCLLGKGGAVVSEMRKTTGAGIQILNKVPKCAPESDQVVQISGDVANLKQAIYHVTGRLRDNMLSSISNTLGTRSSSSSLSEMSSLGRLRDQAEDPSSDIFVDPTRNSLNDQLRATLREPLRGRFLDPSRDTLMDPLGDTYRDPLRDTLRDPFRDTLRHLPRGTLRDPLGNIYRDPLGDIYRDPLGDTYRDPLRDTYRDPRRDNYRDPLRDTYRDPQRDTIREPISAFTEPLREMVRDPAPLYPASSFGIPHGVGHQAALTQSSDHLRNSHVLGRQAALTQSSDHLRNSHVLGRQSEYLWPSPAFDGINHSGTSNMGSGSAPFRGAFEHGSGNKGAIVTNTTVEIVIPENAFAAVYGDNGRNLAHLRQISGAKVIVHEPRLGTRDRIIVISGTPDETQAAQSLLQAFILTGHSD